MKWLAGALAGLALAGLTASTAQAKGDSCDCGQPVMSGPSARYGAPIPRSRLEKWTCEVEGTVLKTTGTTITVFDRGAAIPLDVQDNTQLSGVSSANEIREGDQVRASFAVKHGSNALKSLVRVASKRSAGSAE